MSVTIYGAFGKNSTQIIPPIIKNILFNFPFSFKNKRVELIRKGTMARKIFHNIYMNENLPNKTTLKMFKIIERIIIKTMDFGTDILFNILDRIIISF